MPGRNRPSFLKKQKEMERRARATRKREERRARKQAPQLDTQEPTDLTDLEGAPEPTDDETAGDIPL